MYVPPDSIEEFRIPFGSRAIWKLLMGDSESGYRTRLYRGALMAACTWRPLHMSWYLFIYLLGHD